MRKCSTILLKLAQETDSLQHLLRLQQQYKHQEGHLHSSGHPLPLLWHDLQIDLLLTNLNNWRLPSLYLLRAHFTRGSGVGVYWPAKWRPAAFRLSD